MGKYDIVIVGGQSNAEGNGLPYADDLQLRSNRIMSLSALKKVEHLPEKVRVTYFDEPFQLKIAEEQVIGNGKRNGFYLPFARLYEEHLLETDRKLLLVYAAVGGTGFKKGNWIPTGPEYLKMLEMVDFALAMSPANRLVAFLWHQGEHDAFEQNPPQAYGQQLEFLVQSVRERYNAPQLPFIAGDFVHEWKSKNSA